MSLTPSPPPSPVEPFPVEPSPVDHGPNDPRSVNPGPVNPDPGDHGPIDSSPVDPFEVAGVDWQPVMRQLITVRRWANGLGDGVFLVALGVGAAVWRPWWLFALAGVVLALSLWAQWLISRQVRALAWGLRDRDLVFRQGVKFRKLTYVPFVRIQYVDIKAGPIDRAFGLTSVTVNTAAPGVAATIPGLSPETAARLREALTDKSKLEPNAPDAGERWVSREAQTDEAKPELSSTSVEGSRWSREAQTDQAQTDQAKPEPGA